MLYLSAKAQVAVGDIQAYELRHVWPPVIPGNELQGFEAAWVSSHLNVMTERNYPVVEVRGIWDIDAAAVVEDAVAFQPFHGLEGAGGQLSQFLCSSDDGFLLWLLSSLLDVSQDILFHILQRVSE